ncbi:MAG: hypothetical protein HKN68_21080 [Saprospiraceae bacterium]|nr:hypothetical protein [Saprospiraceae bacterium]
MSFNIKWVLIPICISSLIIACDIQKETIEEMPVPAARSSVFPFLTSDSSNLYLSWIETIHDTIDILKIARGSEEGFEYVTEVARGNDWFVNWADFPKVAAFSSGEFITHWLKKSSSSTYDYNIHVGIGSFGTSQVDTSFILHDNGINAEHGFVSFQPYGKNMIAVWLDGRDTKRSDDAYGQMTLRAAIINDKGIKKQDIEIDNRICDCCQTDLTRIGDDVMAVYRDRSETEIRDNYFSLYQDGQWKKGLPIQGDQWTIAGCPVNGPAIHSHQGITAAIWYSEGSGNPGVYLSVYDSKKMKFQSPIVKKESVDILGRVDVKVMDKDRIAYTWLEKHKDQGILKLEIISKEGKLLKKIDVDIVDSSRNSGFSHLAILKGVIYIAYTSSGSYKGVKVKSVKTNALTY